MSRKLCLFALATVILAVSISVVQAEINASIAVTSNGHNIEDTSVPLNTVADIAVHYDSTNERPAIGALIVWYRASSNSGWTLKEILLAKIIQSPYDKTVQYTFTKPGYYKFSWTVLKTVCETKTVCAKVGPVLPEPGTLAGLAVSIVALGLVFTKKRLTK